MTKELVVTPVQKLDLSNTLQDETLVYLGYTANRQIIVMTRLAETKERSEKRYYNLYLEIDNTLILIAAIADKYYLSSFQFLNNNEILLSGILDYYVPEKDNPHNGRIYSNEGKYQRAILLGDNIADTQVSEGGIIWMSYYYKGIFDDRHGYDPIGKQGLVAWNSSGEKIYEYYGTKEIGSISDCYALNVVSDKETWLYYYNQFPLVKLKNYKIEDYWFMPIKGSRAFAIDNDFALFDGGYGDRNCFYLVKLEKRHCVKIISEIELRNISNLSYIAARRDCLCFLAENKIFQLSISDYS